MTTHTFLVAFQVETPNGDVTRMGAERDLLRSLPRPGVGLSADHSAHLECWWVAEDDREDGSDNDSAVYVHPGNQQAAYDLLRAHGLTGECNDPSLTDGPGSMRRIMHFEPIVSR